MFRAFRKGLGGPLLVVGLFACGIFAQSCFLNTTNTFSADKPCGDGSDPTFCDNMQMVLQPHGCFTSNCHPQWSQYSSPDDYVNAGYIVKGQSGSSLLVQKINGAGYGGDMPKSPYPLLTTTDTAKLTSYIDSL